MTTELRITNQYAPASDQGSGNILELVEYGDYTDARCKALQLVIKNSLPDFGEPIRHTFRHFPNLDSPQALYLAFSAEAARRQGKFWPMHQVLFTHGLTCTSNTLSSLAVDVGLQLDRFLDDLHDETLKASVQADIEGGITAGITKAPALFIGTHRIIGKLTQAKIIPLIQHYLRHTPTQVLSTVDQGSGIINWSNTGCLL
ncbi:DsbA family protein [Spirosoma jeollabukense]